MPTQAAWSAVVSHVQAGRPVNDCHINLVDVPITLHIAHQPIASNHYSQLLLHPCQNARDTSQLKLPTLHNVLLYSLQAAEQVLSLIAAATNPVTCTVCFGCCSNVPTAHRSSPEHQQHICCQALFAPQWETSVESCATSRHRTPWHLDIGNDTEDTVHTVSDHRI